MVSRSPSATSGTGRGRRRALTALAAVAALGWSVALVPGAVAEPTKPAPKRAAVTSDVRELPVKKTYSTKKLPKVKASVREQQRTQAESEAAATAPVGTTRQLLALDDYNGRYYLKNYTLRGVGEHIEMWVANDTSFPANDCRNQVADTTTVTQAQVDYFVDQFDSNIYPKESRAFSVAPNRDGSNPGLPIAGVDPTGDGNKIMTLVDNVRDDNYYDGVNEAPTYIAGFFSSAINEILDRNVMTIDAFDWQHRTSANPPDQVTGDLCTSRPARPFLYEGVFAHEYQHLLHYYTDPNEVNWINEGLSDFAQTLTGYVDASRTVFQRGADSHIYCYQGYGIVSTAYNPNPRDCGGPENSLTLWGDQPPASAILADYGEAYSFMLFLYDRYGLGFMSRLHRDGDNQGLVSLQAALDGYADSVDVYKVLHDFQAMALVDRYVDRRGGRVSGVARSRVISTSLNSSLNLGNPASYARPGAPANGADYVGLRAGSGLYLNGKDLRSVRFSGAKTLVPEPLRWTSVAVGGYADSPALWSGNESNLDATAITSVTVPTANPTLTYTEKHLAEKGYDYAYTVISTDGGKTYTALANNNTVDGPLGPALNGDAATFATQTFDLKAYAGKTVLIGFRYVSDGGVNDGGWWVDNVKVGGRLISNGSSTAPFKSRTQVRPLPVYRLVVRLVGLDTAKHKALVKTYAKRSFSLSRVDVAPFRAYPRVVAIVSYDEPTEELQPQALYTLTVNGVVQPGGGQSSAAVTVKADRF